MHPPRHASNFYLLSFLPSRVNTAMPVTRLKQARPRTPLVTMHPLQHASDFYLLSLQRLGVQQVKKPQTSIQFLPAFLLEKKLSTIDGVCQDRYIPDRVDFLVNRQFISFNYITLYNSYFWMLSNRRLSQFIFERKVDWL